MSILAKEGPDSSRLTLTGANVEVLEWYSSIEKKSVNGKERVGCVRNFKRVTSVRRIEMDLSDTA